MSESVIGITFNEDRSQVLLIKRRDVPIWTLPGGGKEALESYEQAVIREIEEETGYRVRILRKAAFYTPVNRLTNPTHVFECRVIDGKPTKSSETQDVGFFSKDDLPLPFFEIHLDWLEDVLLNQNKLVTKALHQVSYSALIKYFFRHPIWVLRCFLSKIGLPWNSA